MQYVSENTRKSQKIPEKLLACARKDTNCHFGKMTKMKDVGKVKPSVIFDLAPARTKMTDVPKIQRSVILEK